MAQEGASSSPLAAEVAVADGSELYDYSEFSVTLTNTSGRKVEILEVACERKGTAGRSSLGEITD